MALAIGGVVVAVRCSTDGLDQYSSAWDAGPADTGGDACTPSCPPGTCGSDGCGHTCSCADAGCVNGTCFPCSDPWRTSGLSNHGSYDAVRNYIYTSISVDAGPDGGVAFATLNACTGDIVASRTPAPSEAGINPIPTILELVAYGDFRYTRGDCAPGANPESTCVYRYNAATNTADTRGVIATDASSDEVWNITVAGSGKVFASGTSGVAKLPRIIPLAPDGSNCGGAAFDAGVRGGAIGANGDDVYQVVYTGATAQLRLVHFKASTCTTTAPCTCAPDVVYPPLTLPIANANGAPGTYSLLVAGTTIYVVGLEFLTSTPNANGFVAAFDTLQNSWTPVYVYAPSNNAATDALLQAAITPDGKLLYVVGAKAAFTNNSTGVLLRFDLPFPTSSAPTPNGEIVVAGFKTLWDVTVTDTAVFVAGDDATVAKCLPDLSCKP